MNDGKYARQIRLNRLVKTRYHLYSNRRRDEGWIHAFFLSGCCFWGTTAISKTALLGLTTSFCRVAALCRFTLSWCTFSSAILSLLDWAAFIASALAEGRVTTSLRRFAAACSAFYTGFGASSTAFIRLTATLGRFATSGISTALLVILGLHYKLLNQFHLIYIRFENL